jgi:hypothetical protein
MDLAELSEEILYANVAKIGAMANAFEGQIAQNPQEYWVLQPNLVYQDVSNGGPPFQIQDSVFAIWLQNTKTQCPVILRHILNFFRQWVCFDPSRNQPVSKAQLQPLLRSHAATYLLASPTTARMTIGAALVKLMKYAKVFASEGVGKHMAKFVDPVIYKYIAEEFREAVNVLEQARELLHLGDQCCHQVLQGNLFQQTIRTWEESGVSVEHIVLMTTPKSSGDLSAANLQLKALNKDVLAVVRVYTQTLALVQRYREQAQSLARRALQRRELQEAADNEANTIEYKLENVRKQYAPWYPYVRVFLRRMVVVRKRDRGRIDWWIPDLLPRDPRNHSGGLTSRIPQPGSCGVPQDQPTIA